MNKKERKTNLASGSERDINPKMESVAIEEHPVILKDGQTVKIRPLELHDIDKLADFYSKLSQGTRGFYVLDDYGEKTATRLCESLSNPEKMHFVIENNLGEIIAIMKFSLDLPEEDRLRFSNYKVDLVPGTVGRCGLCISDEYQNLGLGTIALNQVIDTSNRLGLKAIYLSGGIFANNERAIHQVKKNGFYVVGEFTDPNGTKHVDMLRINDKLNEN